MKRSSAEKLLHNGSGPIPAKVIKSLGKDFSEARRLGFICYGDGFCSLSNSASVRSVLKKIVEADQAYSVGDSVTVGEDGEAHMGVVQQIYPDGRIRVSFKKPPRSGKRDFHSNEVTRTEQYKVGNRTIAPASPTQPTQTSTSGPPSENPIAR